MQKHEQKLLMGLLVCPICKGSLTRVKASNELICYPCELAFPIVDDIPRMLPEHARQISLEEKLDR